MERSIAIKRLGKILGRNLGYRVDPKAPTQDERDAARAELIASLPAYDKLKAEREARYQAILAGDPEYQRLKAAYEAERKRREKLSGMSHHYKFTAGTTNGMFFMVKAQGDSWEQIIAKLETEKQTA